MPLQTKLWPTMRVNRIRDQHSLGFFLLEFKRYKFLNDNTTMSSSTKNHHNFLYFYHSISFYKSVQIYTRDILTKQKGYNRANSKFIKQADLSQPLNHGLATFVFNR